MIISIHIPKTGGSSFGEILKSVYGENLWINYGQQWNAMTSKKNLISSNIECLHGHFEFNAFDEEFPESQKITWLRDPVERTISLYNHIMNRPDQGNEIIMDIYQNKPSLNEFSGIPWIRNQGLNYLVDSTPSDFKFIGFLENFTASLQQCAKILGWHRIPESRWINRGNKTEVSNIPQETIQTVKKNNKEEYEWREEAKRIFNTE